MRFFAELGIYEPKVLEAWYKLYKTGNEKFFQTLMKAAGANPSIKWKNASSSFKEPIQSLKKYLLLFLKRSDNVK